MNIKKRWLIPQQHSQTMTVMLHNEGAEAAAQELSSRRHSALMCHTSQLAKSFLCNYVSSAIATLTSRESRFLEERAPMTSSMIR